MLRLLRGRPCQHLPCVITNRLTYLISTRMLEVEWYAAAHAEPPSSFEGLLLHLLRNLLLLGQVPKRGVDGGFASAAAAPGGATAQAAPLAAGLMNAAAVLQSSFVKCELEMHSVLYCCC